MKRTILLAICVSILTVLATQLALGIPLRQTPSAQIPEIISYQGLLNDNLGTPLNGNYELTVRIYNQESAGSHLWEETHAGVPVNNGLFNVLLGSVNSLTVAFDEPYYMGLSINGGDELTPRLPFTSVATAFVAKVAYSLAPGDDGNIILNGNVGIGTTGSQAQLEVNGLLHLMPLTNPSVSCDMSKIGIMYFDSSQKKMLICDGTSWNELRGPQGTTGPQGPEGPPGPSGESCSSSSVSLSNCSAGVGASGHAHVFGLSCQSGRYQCSGIAQCYDGSLSLLSSGCNDNGGP